MDSITSWDFIKENYRPDDRIAIVIRNRRQDYTIQRLLSAAEAATPRIQRYLRYENAHGADIYISMNALKQEAKRRAKADIAAIRHLYLDLDQDGDARLQQVFESPSLPKPNYVLDTSPGKHQIIWRVEGFTLEHAEAALRSMAREFGGAPAATDAARVLRLPGFHNKKFTAPVRVEGHRMAMTVYPRADFDLARGEPGLDPARPIAAGGGRKGGPLAQLPGARAISQSERDWAWVREQLRAGMPPDSVQEALAAHRPDKPKPGYYAEHTVKRALEH